jgi:lipopolysaccharide/colanic/teichoic acid biosynthesis glycosyltransferase/glycosyltransferase involved in cell wall biosynthesis
VRLMLIHQAFVQPSEPGGTRHFELASHLVKAGGEATVICSDISYLTGRPTAATRPRFYSSAVEHGIRFCRVRTYGAYHKSYIHRLASFAGFTASAFVAAARMPRPSVILGTSPPPFQAIAAYLAARWHRVPFIYEIRDLFWEYIAQTQGGAGNALSGLGRRLERALCRRAAVVVVNSPGFIPYVKSCGVPEERIALVANGVDTEMFSPDKADRSAWRPFVGDDSYIVLYAGAMGMINDVGTLIAAANLLQDLPDLRLCLMGDGKERPHLIDAVNASGQKNVVFVPAQPKSAMPALIGSADVGVANLRNLPIFRTVYPNKVFDYLAAAKPVVLGMDGEIRRVVDDAGAGVCVEPGNVEAFAAAIRVMYADRQAAAESGVRGRAYVARHFDRLTQAGRFVEILTAVSSQAQIGRPASDRRRYSSTLYLRYGKRAFDIVAGSLLLLLSLPVIGILAIAVWLAIGRPVFFVQDRPGRCGRIFRLFKLRSMSEVRNEIGRRVSDDARLGSFGRALRRSSLDELPELFNVIKGDMSLVGPRPLLVEYLERYTPEQARRHDVRPGLTGWAEVNGRNALSWEDRFQLDCWYVEHVGLGLDLRILARTLVKIVTGEGVSEPGQATKTEFRGTAPAGTEMAGRK